MKQYIEINEVFSPEPSTNKKTTMIEKLIIAGQVAVLYSPGYGAGWSTWANDQSNAEAMIFDKEIATAIHEGRYEEAEEIAKGKFPDEYFGGFKDVRIGWVLQGHRFEIQEYDGNESLRILGPNDGYTA